MVFGSLINEQSKRQTQCNRPPDRFCTCDCIGRRHTRKITVNGSLLSHLRYIYRGYLQIAAIDAQSGSFQWFLLWDPTQPSATRPLAIRKDGTWYCYGWDITKNICEIFGPSGYIRTTYSYTPFGQATTEGDVSQPIQWSSEMHDDQLGLVYYNYRHYNPSDGRWFNRDPIDEHGGWNLYAFVKNIGGITWDNLGNASCSVFDPQFGYPSPTFSLPKTEGWAEAKLDLFRWIVAIHPETTSHKENSEQSLLVKNSSIGKKLIDAFLKKNKNRKKCWEWEKMTNVKLQFGPKEFIADIPNGRAHFTGSGRGDISIEIDLTASKIIAHYQVENVTSLTSFLYGIAPELKYPGPFGNWKQIYKWSIEYSCCLKNMPEDIKIKYQVEDFLKNTFPYNLPDHFQPTSICLPF